MKRSLKPRDAHRALPALVLMAAALTACADETTPWDEGIPSPLQARGLDGSVALVDVPEDRILMLAVDGDAELIPTSIPVAEGIVATATTLDAKKLVVLSRGVQPRRSATDEGPSVAIIEGGTEPKRTATYPLADPLSGIAVDPAARFVVVHPAERDVAFVQNPNELVVLDLERRPGADNPTPISLRSYGGRPQGFTFTEPLGLPGGSRRLLVVQTDRDVAILDLANLGIPEITVRLTSGDAQRRPVGIAIDDGAPERDDDARIAVRTESDAEVVLVDLAPVAAEDVGTTPQSFRALPNVVYVGGVPSDVAFVQTDDGLRLAALVPSRQVLALIEPTTGAITDVELGAPFEHLSIVTEVVADGGNGDVALLWSSSSPQIALASLGGAVGAPYRSIERIDLASPVGEVTALTGENRHLRVLTSTFGDDVVVLDLLARTAAPLSASGGATLVPSADGQRGWLISPNQAAIALLDFETLHPRNFALSHGVISAFDITRKGGGRALVAVHGVGAGSLTVLDALDPSLATAREHVGVLLGGLQ